MKKLKERFKNIDSWKVFYWTYLGFIASVAAISFYTLDIRLGCWQVMFGVVWILWQESDKSVSRWRKAFFEEADYHMNDLIKENQYLQDLKGRLDNLSSSKDKDEQNS